MEVNQQVTTFKWVVSCDELVRQPPNVLQSHTFELSDGSKLRMRFRIPPYCSDQHLYIMPVKLKEDRLLGVYAKLWLEGAESKKITDFYAGTMTFKSLDQLSDAIPIISYETFKNLQKDGYFNRVLIFCCEVQIKEDFKAAEPKLIEPNSYIEFRQNLWALYNEGLHRNAIALKLEGKEFKVSHDVLTSQSEVFKNMFSLNTIEAQSGMVEIKDVSIKAIEIFVIWLYLGQIEGIAEVANELFVFADKYAFSELKFHCLNYMHEELTLENVFSRLTMSFIYDDEKLKQKCLNFIGNSPRADNLPSLLTSEEWLKLNNSNPELASKVVSAIFEKK